MNAHQLEEEAVEALCLTPKGLAAALAHAKKNGFTGMTLVPLLFHSDLTAEVAAQTAAACGMRIDACGLLPGDRFSPHSTSGKQAAADELLRQSSFQQHWHKAKVGGNTLWGPTGQGFMGEFDLDGYKEWIHTMSLIAANQNLWFGVEILNEIEQAAAPEDIFGTTIEVIDEVTNNGRIGVHYDTVHAWKRLGKSMLEFFRDNESSIFVLELANENRLPFDVDCGIDFDGHVAEIRNLRRGIPIGSEAFCSSVIQALKIGHIYNSPFPGRVARERNAAHLKAKGWM